MRQGCNRIRFAFYYLKEAFGCGVEAGLKRDLKLLQCVRRKTMVA